MEAPARHGRVVVSCCTLGNGDHSGFQSKAANHATAGGMNEHFLKQMVGAGLLTSVSEALDGILHRINTESSRPNVGANA